MVQIQDSTGQGNGLKIDHNNRAHTLSIIQTDDRDQAIKGKTWSYYFTATPTAAGDYFFYFKNTGEKTLVLTDFRIWCAAPETFLIEKITSNSVAVVI